MRNPMKFCFAVVMAVSVFVTSCGTGGASSGEVQPTNDTTLDNLMVVGMEDASCDAGSTSSSGTTAGIWQWNGSGVDQKSVALKTTVSSDQGLQSSGILGAAKSLKIQYTCTEKGGVKSCGKGSTVVDAAVIKLCRSDATYGRNSLEGITVTSQYFVGKARDRYQALTNRKTGLADALLLIQPLFVRNVTKAETGQTATVVDVDNASYAPGETTSKSGYFIVYPTSTTEFAKGPVHLWEVPFVMSHEYGHNVFNHHVGDAAKNAGYVMDIDLDVNAIMPHRYRSDNQFHKLFGSDTAKLALNGVNEMFADLFAFYVNDAKAGQLTGLRCLDKTRDPLSGTIPSGTAKVWTKSENDIFEGTKSATYSPDCTQPLFNDEHDVAAVFGFVIADLMKGLMGDGNADKKLDVLLQWTNKLSTYITQTGSSITLDGMIKLLVDAIVANKTAATADVQTACANFKTRASALTTAIAACN